MPDESSEVNPELIERYLTGECTPAERAVVDAWSASDPTHAAELAALREAWQGWAGARPTPSVDSAWSKMANRMSAARAPEPAASGPALHVTGEHRIDRSRPWWRVGVAAAAVVVVGVGVVTVWRRVIVGPPTPAQEFVSGVAERTAVVLSDGTRLTLGPDSRLRVPANYGRAGRDVALDGEASFAVRHDASHPFAVRTADGVIRDIGTTFAVRDYPTDREMDVVVAEGSVSLQSAGDTLRPPVVLVRGERAQLLPGAAPVVASVDADQYLAWTTGRLVFRDAPLRQVVSELARWYDLDVRLTDPSIGGLRLTTSFQNEPLSEVLDAVGAALQVHIERTGRAVTISPRPAGAHGVRAK